jgi:hypothetical protein
LVAIELADNVLSAIQEQLPMTSKLLRIVPMVLAISIPAVAADPAAPPADAKHESKDAKKKKDGEKKDEKKADEKKEEKK